MWKRYECPTRPSETLFGPGGKKQFANGVFITGDEDKQAALEANDKFGVTIHLVSSGKTEPEVSPPPPTMQEHLDAIEADQEAVHPPIHLSPLDGDVKFVAREGDEKAEEPKDETPDPTKLTPEQRIRFALLGAGFDKGCDIDAVLEEMGIDMALPPAKVADAVEARLEPLMNEPTPKQPDAPPDAPGKTEIHRMKHDDLMTIAKKYKIPNTTPIMASAKRLRAHLYNYFYGQEVGKE